ncbi:MAG: hypothetical protein AMXMBFR84_35680 [Candidatus Hydrogenedentota bacterium]
MKRLTMLGIFCPLFFICIGATGWTQEAGDVTLEPYSFKLQGTPVEATKGTLFVPENRSTSSTNLIELAFIVIKSSSPSPKYPTIYLVGGPGGSGIDIGRSIRAKLINELRAVGDVIIFDQRGTGISKPNLEFEDSWNIPLDQPLDKSSLVTAAVKNAEACTAFFRSKGVDLRAYNTNENADDVDAIRAAIGAEKINLCASSYGTHLAFAVMRRHGSGVNRAVLCGVEGPDDTLKLPESIQANLEKIEALCKQDEVLSAQMPSFMGLIDSLIKKLHTTPVSVSRVDPRTKKTETIVLGSYDLKLYVAEMSGRLPSIRTLPAELLAMEKGDFENIARLSMFFRKGGVGSAMSLYMDCASGVSETRLATIRQASEDFLLGDGINDPYPEICAACGDVDLGKEFRSDLVSDIPVLFFSGSLDNRTPYSNAEKSLVGFSNGISILIENVGHDEQLFSGIEEMRTRTVKFLSGETVSSEIIHGGDVVFKKPAA